MKLYFIWPNIGDFKTGEEFDDKGRMEPLIFALLAALTPGQHEKYFFDDRIELDSLIIKKQMQHLSA
jgi:hypothetical protein